MVMVVCQHEHTHTRSHTPKLQIDSCDVFVIFKPKRDACVNHLLPDHSMLLPLTPQGVLRYVQRYLALAVHHQAWMIKVRLQVSTKSGAETTLLISANVR